MTEVLTFNNLNLFNKTTKNSEISIKMSKEGLAVKNISTDEIFSITKEELKKIHIFYGLQNYNLQIQTDETFHNIFGIDEEMKNTIKKVFDDWYDHKIIERELEVGNTVEGEFECTDSAVVYKFKDKPIFEIQKMDIKDILELKGDVSITLPAKNESISEIKFSADEKFLHDLKTTTNLETQEFYKIEGIKTAYPRGRSDLIFYNGFLKLIGKTYEHKITYDSIGDIYFLEKQDGYETLNYFICSLKNPIKQGISFYDHIAFLIEEKDYFEIECANFTEARKFYKDISPAYENTGEKVFSELLSVFCKKEIEKSDVLQTTDENNYINCSLRAYSGSLHFLDSHLIFLPKVHVIDIKSIISVEFARINISAATAKTFDMKIIGETNFDLNGFNKDTLGILEKYFDERNIKMTTEVIQDVSSEDENDYAYSMTSDIEGPSNSSE